MTGLLEYDRAYKLLQKYKIKSIDSKYVDSAGSAIKFANNKPIVLKGLSKNAIHKTKSGLIELNLISNAEITAAYNRLTKKAQKFKPYRILVQHMAKQGIEIIIGGKIDQQFGKLILLGLGGIYVETFKDFALRVCPISKYDAQSMLNQMKSRKVIAPDEKSERMIVDLVMKASKLFAESRISELDLNPIIVHQGTYDAVDIRMIE